jgi:hypothetical protein
MSFVAPVGRLNVEDRMRNENLATAKASGAINHSVSVNPEMFLTCCYRKDGNDHQPTYSSSWSKRKLN